MRFTDRAIARLPPPPPGTKDYFRFDDKMPGLGVRVTHTSKILYSQDRKSGRHPLGKFPALTIAQARNAVKVLAGKVAGGADLREEKAKKKAKRDQARADVALTLGHLNDLWEEAHRSKRKSGYVKASVEGVRRAYADLLDRPATAITPEEFEAVWGSLADLPAAAHMAGVRIKKLYSWAVRTRKIDVDPTARTTMAEKTGPRDRELSDDESRAVWKAASNLTLSQRTLIRSLQGTGLRLRETAGSRYSEFNPDFSKQEISSSRMKTKLQHVVPIPPILRKMLAELPRFEGSDFVFTTDGRRPIGGFSYLKKQLDKALAGAVAEPFTFHDFRRSIVGWLVRNGVDSLVADKLLAHTRTSKLNAVGAVYNKYDFLAERATALERWTSFLAGGEESETRSNPTLLLPAPEPETTVAPPVATPRVATLGDFVQAMVHKDTPPAATPLPVILGDFTQAMAHKDEVAARLIARFTRILTNPDVMHANEQIRLKTKFASAFKEKHRGDPHSAAFLTLTYRAAELAINGETVLKRPEIEAQRAGWRENADKLRTDAKRAKAEARQARELGQEEFACEADARAREFDRKADNWEQMLMGYITTDDPRCVEYRSAEATHASSRAKGVLQALRLLNVEIFGNEHGTWAAAYAEAAVGWEVSRDQGRRRLKAKIFPLKSAAH